MGLLDRQKAIAEANIRKSFSVGEFSPIVEEEYLSKGGKRTGYFQDNAENRAKHRVGQKYSKDKMTSFADREKPTKGAIVYGKGGASKTSFPTVQIKSPHTDKMETMVKDGGEWKLKVGGELTKVSAARQAKAEEKHSGGNKVAAKADLHKNELKELKMLRSNATNDLDRHKIDKRIKQAEAHIKHANDFAEASGKKDKNLLGSNTAEYKSAARAVTKLLMEESGSDSKKLGTAMARKLMEVGTNYATFVKNATKNIVNGKYDGKEVALGLNKVKASLQKENTQLDNGELTSTNKDKIKDMNNAAIAKIKSVVEVIEIASNKVTSKNMSDADVDAALKKPNLSISKDPKVREAVKAGMGRVIAKLHEDKKALTTYGKGGASKTSYENVGLEFINGNMMFDIEMKGSKATMTPYDDKAFQKIADKAGKDGMHDMKVLSSIRLKKQGIDLSPDQITFKDSKGEIMGNPEYDYMDIAQFAGVNKNAAIDSISSMNLDVGKLYDHVVPSGTPNVAQNRMDFMTVVSGKFNNAKQREFVKKFGKTPAKTLASMSFIDKMNKSDKKEKESPKTVEDHMGVKKPTMPKEKSQEIARTILQQMGGQKLIAMTGAKQFRDDGNGALSFRIPGKNFAKNGINHIRIQLNSMDTYDMTFGKVRAGKFKVIEEKKGIYNDKLRSTFTNVTGLNTSLGTMGKSEEDTLEKGDVRKSIDENLSILGIIR